MDDFEQYYILLDDSGVIANYMATICLVFPSDKTPESPNIYPHSIATWNPHLIQPNNKIIMDDRQTICGRQSVSLPNFFVAEDIVHYLPNFRGDSTWRQSSANSERYSQQQKSWSIKLS